MGGWGSGCTWPGIAQARWGKGKRLHVAGRCAGAVSVVSLLRGGGMERLRWQVVAVASVGLALALEVLPSVLLWLRTWRRRQQEQRPQREVLFFPSQVTCTEALLQAPDAGPSASLAGCGCSLPHIESSLSRLLRALLAARASLELCLFAFSSPQLGRAVQLLHQRGVRVRVITDCDYMALNGSQIGLLRKAGKPGFPGPWRGSEPTAQGSGLQAPGQENELTSGAGGRREDVRRRYLGVGD